MIKALLQCRGCAIFLKRTLPGKPEFQGILTKFRDEKDRPFCGPTRTGFGADFELVQTSDHGFGPDRSVGGPSESDQSDRTEKIGK